MASVSMIEGLAKKFINMVPRPFYTEAAQKLVHEICETIYKDLDKEKKPKEEIIQIVENFITAHLQNTDTETPSGIRKAIEDNLAKTTLEVYKDEKINMLLLQKILSEEIGTDGVFYKSLEQSINITNDPTNTPIMQNSNTGTGNGSDSKNDDSKDIKKVLNKDSETFAKKVVNELVNTNVEIAQSDQPLVVVDKTNDINQYGGANLGKGATDGYTKFVNNASDKLTNFADENPLTTAAIVGVGSAMLNGKGSGSSNGSSSGGVTNIGYEPNKDGVLPYIQTNCNGSGLGLGLGLPNIDFNMLKPLLDGLKEPIAEELVKKIQERLSDKTTNSLTVKRDIYNKILLVIQAHLEDEQGKAMLSEHIKKTIEPEIEKLTTNNEIKKRLLKVIFKDKNSEIYKKLIEIIASHSSPIVVAEPLPPINGATSTAPSANAELMKTVVQNGGKESKPFQVNTIEIVIQEFSTWLNEKIGPTQQPENETSVVAVPFNPSAPPVKTKANVIDPSKLPLADVVMINDGKDTSISTSVEDAAVNGNNDNPTETYAGKEKVDIKVEQQKNEQLSNVENIQTTKDLPAGTNAINASQNVNTTNDSTASKIAADDKNITDIVDKKKTELKPIIRSNTLNSPIVEKKKLPSIGGNPTTKNKTKKRRTKNNKRKTSKTLKNKQKRRVTKKKNRKHNQKK